jgi:putative DNA primase/helicase
LGNIEMSDSNWMQILCDYAADNWHLFPVGRDKKPLTEHGFKDATQMQAGITEYLKRYPGCNWAGFFDNQLIIDIDPRHGGSLEILEAKVGKLPKTRTHKTGGGGLHLLFKQPHGYFIRNTVQVEGLQGIDRRGNGGYVVLPPSVHESGHSYEVLDASPIVEAPAALLKDDLKDNRRKEGKPITKLVKGRRHVDLISYIGKWRNRGFAENEILIQALALNNSSSDSLPESEVLNMVRQYENPNRFEIKDYRLTDLGNAERLIDRHGEKLRFSYSRKKWLLWNGKYWEWVEDGRVISLAGETIRNIYHQAANEPDKERRQAFLDHARRSESEGRLSAMVILAQSLTGVAIDIEHLDANEHLLNVNNGTVDLKTGELRPHDKNDYITAFISVDYEATTRSALWDEVLRTIFGDKEGVNKYVQRALGYSCTGSQNEQVVFFPYGPGQNGKSTLLGSVRDCLGSDYSADVEPQVFMVSTREATGPNEGVARLFRKRLALSTEIEDGQKLSVSLIKRMTGGEKLHHEKKFEHGFEFTPTHKLWLSGNHKAIISDTTLSIWRRVKFINFNVTIPEEKRIKNLRDLLKSPEHQKAILAWLVEGAVEWFKHGLGEPPEVTEATNKYREEMDLLAEFLRECCLISNTETITVAELYKAYAEWAKANDFQPLGKNNFNKRLEEKGFCKCPGAGNKTIWKGIRLQSDDDKLTIQAQKLILVNQFPKSNLVKENSIKDT